MLDAAPKSFHKDDVISASPVVHADRDLLALEHPGEDLTGELRPLVAVEHLRFAVHAQSILRAFHAKRCLHAVADTPTEHPPREPVDDGYQIRKAPLQADVGDVREPDLVGPHHRHAA
jgi:hypothetical protein